MTTRTRVVGVVLCGAAMLLLNPLARATVEMQKEAKRLGYPVRNCLYCHASAHAVKKMKQKARELNMADGNCLLCHGARIPATLNHRGEWLVKEKERRGAEQAEMAWLKDYVEPEEDDSEKTAPKE